LQVREDLRDHLRLLDAGKDRKLASALALPWAAEDLRVAMEPYYAKDERILRDPDARNHTRTYVTQDDNAGTWTVAQVLVDPRGLIDWQATFTADKALAKEEGKPTLALLGLSAIGCAISMDSNGV